MELQKSEIGLRIRMRRKECKFTGEYLAEMAGISPEFLRGMSLQTLSSLAHTLQTTTDYLLFGTANEEKYAILIQTLDQCPEDKLSHLITILDDILLYQSSISQNE